VKQPAHRASSPTFRDGQPLRQQRPGGAAAGRATIVSHVEDGAKSSRSRTRRSRRRGPCPPPPDRSTRGRGARARGPARNAPSPARRQGVRVLAHERLSHPRIVRDL
jgi:hypothetical protein